MVTALNELARTVVLTGSHDIEAIRTWEETAPPGAPQFVEVPDRRLSRFMRWHRIPEFTLYLIWSRKAKQRARRIIANEHIDATAHVTYSAFWLPAAATGLGKPCVWGPVGGGVTTPRSLWRVLGLAGLAQELLDFVAVRIMAALPASRRTARTAAQRLMQNTESLELLPSDVRSDSQVVNHALYSIVPPVARQPKGHYALWVSPMESRKGPRLILEAVARTASDIPLIMVGDGPQRTKLERRAAQLGIADRVTFTGRIPREEVVSLMSGATTVVFTGLREEGGLALAEAMHAARRLVVLDHGGAGAVARCAVDPARVALISPAGLRTVASAIAGAIDDHVSRDEPKDEPLLDRAEAMDKLAAALRSALQ